MRTVVEPYDHLVKKCKYAVYEVEEVKSELLMEYQAIVIKDVETNLIIKITDFADYVIYRVLDESERYKTDKGSLYTTCQFLNFVFFENYEKYRIESVFDLKKEMVFDFLNMYSMTRTKNGRYPKKQSIKDKRAVVCLFIEMLCHYNKKEMKYLKRGDLVHTHIYKEGYKTRYRNEYLIYIRYMEAQRDELDQLLRDMPISISDRFIKMAEIYEPELCFAIVLQLYGGLRCGEVCNVRRKESSVGPGVIINSIRVIDKKGNPYLHAKSFQIDLRKEYTMRTDEKCVGKIKSKSFASIFGPFTDIVYRYYLKHLEIIRDKDCEPVMPMFLCKNKNSSSNIYYALTKASYIKRVKSLFYKHVLPSLENDPDPDLANFYLQMRTHTWGPHAFRHWFTVFLIYCGVDDLATLKDLRRDRDPHSAEVYLKRKGVLMRTYEKSLNVFGNMIKQKN